MRITSLYSIIIELQVEKNAVLPFTLGQKAHALFLSLIEQINPSLAHRLHEEPKYRPFTVSSLLGGTVSGHEIHLKEGQTCALRVTLLDGGALWECVSTFFLEKHAMVLHLGEATFTAQRIISQPQTDTTGWAAHTTWQQLASTEAQSTINFRFTSPTAFSLGNRRFALYPEPLYVWDSLLRSWNLYAPEVLQLDKGVIREFVTHFIRINDYQLHTTTLYYPKYIQKGFMGLCSYHIQSQEAPAPHIAALATFAHFSGIGYKTTMGMGQVQVILNNEGHLQQKNARASAVEPLSVASRKKM